MVQAMGCKGAARLKLTGNSDFRGEGDLMRSGAFLNFWGALARLAPLPCIPIATSPCAILWIYINIMFIIVSRGDFDDVFVHLSCACGPASAACAQKLPDVGYTPSWDKHSPTENIAARFPRLQPEAPIHGRRC